MKRVHYLAQTNHSREMIVTREVAKLERRQKQEKEKKS